MGLDACCARTFLAREDISRDLHSTVTAMLAQVVHLTDVVDRLYRPATSQMRPVSLALRQPQVHQDATRSLRTLVTSFLDLRRKLKFCLLEGGSLSKCAGSKEDLDAWL